MGQRLHVRKVITEQTGNTKLWLGVSDENWVSLSFADGGKSAMDKKEGDELKVMCDAGGKTDTFIMMLRCELQ